MKIFNTLSFILLIVTSCQFGNNNNSRHQILLDSLTSGSFIEGYSDLGTELTFNLNGTFEQTKYSYSDYINPDEPSGTLTTIKGTFRLDTNYVQLSPQTILKKEDWGDSIAIIDSLIYQESPSTWIRRSLNIVFWTGNTYLLSEDPVFFYGLKRENDFIDFANNYNAGSEPRWPDMYFVKRLNRKIIENINLEQIPLTLRNYFLNEPAKATITELRQESHYDSIYNQDIETTIYYLDGGKLNGIQVGMLLFGKKGCCTVKIFETTDSTSRGYVVLCRDSPDNCLMNDTLTTWNQRDNGNYVPQQTLK